VLAWAASSSAYSSTTSRNRSFASSPTRCAPAFLIIRSKGAIGSSPMRTTWTFGVIYVLGNYLNRVLEKTDMALGFIIFSVALVLSLIASFTDIKTREVPNSISFGLIGAMLVFRVMQALDSGVYTALWTSLAVGGGFLALGLAFFYAQQWGGADLKLLTAYGLGFGVLWPEFTPTHVAMWPFFMTLLMNFFMVSVFYSVIYAIGMASQEPKVMRGFKASLHRYELLFGGLLIIGLLSIGLVYSFLFFLVLIPTLWFLTKFLKQVEDYCMHKITPVSKLVEFDIPRKDIMYRGKVLVARKDPNGMTLENVAEIRKLAKQGKIPKKFSVRWGVPLIPVFPITLVVTLFYGDLLLAFLQWMLL